MAEVGAALEPGRKEVNHDSLSWDCIVMLMDRVGRMSGQASRHMILEFLSQYFPRSALLQSPVFSHPSGFFGRLHKEMGTCQLPIP